MSSYDTALVIPAYRERAASIKRLILALPESCLVILVINAPRPIPPPSTAFKHYGLSRKSLTVAGGPAPTAVATRPSSLTTARKIIVHPPSKELGSPENWGPTLRSCFSLTAHLLQTESISPTPTQDFRAITYAALAAISQRSRFSIQTLTHGISRAENGDTSF